MPVVALFILQYLSLTPYRTTLRASCRGAQVDTGVADGRYGPFDAAASSGQGPTGFTVGGVGWCRQPSQTN